MESSRTETEYSSYAEGAPLMALFDTPAKTKIVSVFVSERGRDLTKSEIARQAGVSRSTVYEHLEKLLDLGVVHHTRTTQAGQSPRYQFNEESSIGASLHELEGVILRRLLELDEEA